MSANPAATCTHWGWELTTYHQASGIWPHVFPPDRQVPALCDLILISNEVDEVDEPIPPAAAAAGTDDISFMIRCCPGLHSISVDVQPDAQLSDLTKASGLTSLSVWGLQPESFESLRALSGMVSLQELSVNPGGPITPQDLLCLTALVQLTELSIRQGMASEFNGADDVYLELTQVCTMSANLYLLMSVNHHMPLHHRGSTSGLHVDRPSCICVYCIPSKLKFHMPAAAMLCFDAVLYSRP